MNNLNERVELIAALRLLAQISGGKLVTQAADMLEADAREIEGIECDYTDQVLREIAAEEKLAQQVTQPTWKAERIDDYEIRVTSPEGESWRLRSADSNDSFNNFIWRWAESMVSKGD